MLEEKFKSGDVVRLKSGGQKMTVESSYLTPSNTAYMVNCAWFDEREAKKERFRQEALELVETEEREFFAG